MKILPSFFTEKMDSNKFVLSVVTFYICETGIGSYDFKVNLFI